MLAAVVHTAMAQAPLGTTCGAVKTFFKDSECCSPNQGTKELPLATMDICPSIDLQLAHPVKVGIFSPCPSEEVYYEFLDENPVAPGYKGCVAEAGMSPCGW
eukprot:scaffold1240_cov101-Isochrysis_galbana.AAC.13